MGKIDDYKMILLVDAKCHCEYLNESIKEARNKLWVLTSITISVIGFLIARLNTEQIMMEEKLLFFSAIPFLSFNLFYIFRGMMPLKKQDLHPDPHQLEELDEESYFFSKMEFYKNVSVNYQNILKVIISSYVKCTYSLILFLLFNVFFFVIRFITEICSNCV
jgi:hypothetical protein